MNAKKKILMFSSADYTVSTRFTRLAKIFNQGNFDVTIICCDRSFNFPKVSNLNGIKIIFIKSFLSKLKLNFIIMPFFLLHVYIKMFFKILHHKFDFIYAYTFDMQIISILIKKIFKKKLIYDSAEYYPGMVGDRVPYPIFSLIRTLYYKFAGKADLVLTTNTWTKYQFRLAKVDNVKMISNVPELDMFFFNPSVRKTTRDLLNLKEDVVLFSFIGFLAEFRGLEEIIEATKLLRENVSNFKILIVGRGPIKGKVMNLIKSYNLTNYFIVLDFVKFDKVPRYINASDAIFILYNPNRLNNWYAVPNKLFEAVACQRAIIGSNFGYLKNLILEMNCGLLVNPTDAEDIAEKMKSLIKDTDLRKRLGINGIKHIRDKYNLEHYSKILLNEVKKLN